MDSYLQYSTEVSVEIISYRDSDNVLPAITVCNENTFGDYLFKNKMDEESSSRLVLNRKINTLYVAYGSKTEVHQIENFRNFFHKLFNIRNLTEDNFRKNEIILNDKNESGLEFIKSEIDFYSSLMVCYAVPETSRVFSANINFLSPLGKCYTYFSGKTKFAYDFDKKVSNMIMEVHDYAVDSLYDIYKHFNVPDCINRKVYIHSMDTLPVLSSEELFFSYPDKNEPQFRKIIFKETKIEFKKLPRPYETNCQNYGKSNRFKCLNNCYFKEYQDSIECIPNFNSLYTFKLSDRNNEQNISCSEENQGEVKNVNLIIKEKCTRKCHSKLYCLIPCYKNAYIDSIKCIPKYNSLYNFNLGEKNDEKNINFCPKQKQIEIKSLNNNITEKCDKKCLESCDDLYFNTEFEKGSSEFTEDFRGQTSTSPTPVVYRIYPRYGYYRKINYSPKITFFSLIIDLANTWSLWHGISIFRLFYNLNKILKNTMVYKKLITLICKLLTKFNFNKISMRISNKNLIKVIMKLILNWF